MSLALTSPSAVRSCRGLRRGPSGPCGRGRIWSLGLLGCWLAGGSGPAARSADQPQWGQAWSRNMVSGERRLPESFDPKTGRNIKWTAALGTETHSTPVVAGERVYLVSNRGEVLCLDARGLANSNDGPFLEESAQMTPRGTNAPPQPLQPGPRDADILWLCDLTREAGIWSHDAEHSSILIQGDYLYVNSGTGVDNTHKRIRTPDAPSLVVLDKRTGRILARDDEHMAPRIFRSEERRVGK